MEGRITPNYRSLCSRTDAPAGSSWGAWDDGRLGALNLIDAHAVLRGRDTIRTGRVFPLDIALDEIDPPLFGRSAPRHEIRRYPSGAQDDVLNDWNTQSTSQWDGFRHVRHPEHGNYDGIPDESHGVGAWAAHGIATRAVIADVAALRSAEGTRIRHDRRDIIDVSEIRACLDRQAIAVERGDVLLVHTGWLAWYRSLDPAARDRLGSLSARELRLPGLSPDDATAEFLWDTQVAAIASDVPALEAWPPEPDGRYLHHTLLTMLGIPIGELWNLGPLAGDCQLARTWDCFLTSAPLHLPHGVASPANAIAIR